MSRLSEFTIDELYAVVFALDIAQTVEPLDELAAALPAGNARRIAAAKY